MALLELPIRTDTDAYGYQIQLEGSIYALDFHWNSRSEQWVMGISEPDGTPLVWGIPLVVDSDLIRQFNVPGLPPGQLVAVDTSGTHAEAGHDDLGDRVRLAYVESTP